MSGERESYLNGYELLDLRNVTHLKIWKFCQEFKMINLGRLKKESLEADGQQEKIKFYFEFEAVVKYP